MPFPALAVALPTAFLLLQFTLFALLPSLMAAQAAHILMIAAPLLACIAASWRGLRERQSARLGWLAAAAAFGTWAVGAFGNFWNEIVLGRPDEMFREAILAFNLAIVPLLFLLAGEWRLEGRRIVRVIDATLALALGYGYFLFTWSMLTARGAPDADGVQALMWLMDAQNLLVAAASLVRWMAARDGKERELFRALAAYTASYFVVAFVNNHFIAARPELGAQVSSIVTAVFALAAYFALSESRVGRAPIDNARFSSTVRSASPLFLAVTLLIVSLSLIRVDYPLGAAGIIIAVIGYGVRSTVTQVKHIEHGAALRRSHTELRQIASTDALTGVANRRFFDQALSSAWRAALRKRQPLSLLMIDIDHFKRLNDHYGHPVGDARLRQASAALKQALTRSGDVLARYGGEEFAVLLPDCSVADALPVAERLRAAVEDLALKNVGSPLGVLTVSIGAASLLPLRKRGASALVAAADRALYRAKGAGRNRVRATLEGAPERAPAAAPAAQDAAHDAPQRATRDVTDDRRGPNRATNVVRPRFRGSRHGR